MVAAIFSVSLLIPWLGAPVAAAGCTLTAPPTVVNGTPIALVAGSGFPASTDVDLAFTIEGGPSGKVQVQTDPDGAFQINLTQATRGTMTVVATAGAACKATVVVKANAAAVAGASSGPRTDATATVPSAGAVASPTAWLVAVLLVVLGLGGLIATRPTARR
jgi:hypothetical protein